MQVTEIKTMLSQLGIPLTYYSFPEKMAPSLPYLVWYFPNSANFDADNRVYKKIEALNVELYTDTKDFDLEAALENILDQFGVVWEKTESYLNSEHMYEVLYETEVLIDG